MVQKGRSKSLQNKARAIIAKAKPACYLCGRPIDYSLMWPDPMCFVVDHIVAIANGGSDHISNKAAAHNSCNSKKRARAYAPIIRRSGSLE